MYIDGSSTVKFEDCGIYSNSAGDVGSTYLNRFLELSSIAPLKVVSRNLLCGSFCCREEASTSGAPVQSSLRIAEFTQIPEHRWDPRI